MQIREMSDIHNEFGTLTVDVSEEDKQRTLILAGDIDYAPNVEKNVAWINNLAEWFKHVIYIPGNHEFYGGDIHRTTKFYKQANWHPNVHFMDHESIELDGVVFWAGTMWTGLNGGKDEYLIRKIAFGMNDFRHITWDEGKSLFTPHHMMDIYETNKPKLFATVAKAKAEGKKSVVVTHHAPASPSIAKHYRGHDMNDAYCMYLDIEIEDNGPDLWFHGHTHVSSNYKCGNTEIFCNPRGYYQHEENRAFIQDLIVEI